MRIQNTNSEYSAKPKGILKCAVVDITTHLDMTDLPPMNWLRGKDFVLELKVMPDGHDKLQSLYIPIKLTYKDNELDVNEAGIVSLYKMLDSLGLSSAGFTADGGAFSTHEDKEIANEDIATYLIENIMKQPGYRVQTHIYKQTGKDGTPKYFKASRWIGFSEKDLQFLEKQAKLELEYEAGKIGSRGPETPPVIDTTVRRGAFSRKI